MTTNDQNIALKLEHVTKRFSGLTAVSDVSFEMKKTGDPCTDWP